MRIEQVWWSKDERLKWMLANEKSANSCWYRKFISQKAFSFILYPKAMNWICELTSELCVCFFCSCVFCFYMYSLLKQYYWMRDYMLLWIGIFGACIMPCSFGSFFGGRVFPRNKLMVSLSLPETLKTAKSACLFTLWKIS